MVISWVLVLATLELAGMFAIFFFGYPNRLTCVIGGALVMFLMAGAFGLGAVCGSVVTIKELRFFEDGNPKDEVVLKFLGWEKRFKMAHESDAKDE